MRIYLIRHADPDYMNRTITPAGHLEAEALARRMSAEGLDHIYTSPLGRARDTAAYTSKLMHKEPIVEEWTRELSEVKAEIDGQIRCAWDLHGEQVRAQRPFPNSETWLSCPPFDGPEFKTMWDGLRSASDIFIERHGYRREDGRYRVVNPNREKIAVFCHGGFGLTWLAHLLEVPVPIMWAGFFLHPSSVTTILFDERSTDWAVPRAIGVGDISHLHEARLSPQPSGVKANYH